MRWAKFGVTAAFAFIVFLFYLVTQMGYWSLSASSMSAYKTMLILAGLVIIMAFQSSGD